MVTNVKLPESVAADYKYTGNGATRYGVTGFGIVNVETMTKATAAALVARGVHFLAEKTTQKPKAKKPAK